jgi:glycosyltransferase involved in cell wall biosynthesis
VLVCADSESDLAELIRVAHCGIVVPPGSAEALAHAITGAMRDALGAVAMGEAGRRHVLTHYTRPSISAQYDALIREAARGPAPQVIPHG